MKIFKELSKEEQLKVGAQFCNMFAEYHKLMQEKVKTNPESLADDTSGEFTKKYITPRIASILEQHDLEADEKYAVGILIFAKLTTPIPQFQITDNQRPILMKNILLNIQLTDKDILVPLLIPEDLNE